MCESCSYKEGVHEVVAQIVIFRGDGGRVGVHCDLEGVLKLGGVEMAGLSDMFEHKARALRGIVISDPALLQEVRDYVMLDAAEELAHMEEEEKSRAATEQGG